MMFAPSVSNTNAGVQRSLNNRRPSWSGPLLMLGARLGFAIAVQAIVAWVFFLRGEAMPWLSAAPWWTVYGTLIDIGCLLALIYCMRRERSRVSDLVGIRPARLGRDFLIGLAYAAGILPFAMLGGFLGTALIYRSAPGPIPIGPLPLVGALYSFLIWPVIWAITEEVTYLGYVLPHLEILTGRTSIAFVMVVLFWSVQHCAMPLRLDLRFMLWRAITSLPVVALLSLIFIRTRRLPPLIVAHWTADALAVLVTALLPALRR
jgi:membrane protease YdiL (CAAX protease family)